MQLVLLVHVSHIEIRSGFCNNAVHIAALDSASALSWKRPKTPTLQANRWQQLSPGGTAPTARSSHTAAWSPAADGMYVFGGFEGSSRVLSAAVALHGSTELNPLVQRWKPFWWGFSYLNDLQFYDRQAENRIEFGGVRMAAVDAAVDGMGMFSCRFPQKL